jgi:hypothetical protein
MLAMSQEGVFDSSYLFICFRKLSTLFAPRVTVPHFL